MYVTVASRKKSLNIASPATNYHVMAPESRATVAAANPSRSTRATSFPAGTTSATLSPPAMFHPALESQPRQRFSQPPLESTNHHMPHRKLA